MASPELDQSKLIKYSLIAIIIIVVIAILVYSIKSIRRFFGLEVDTIDVQWNETEYIDGGGDVGQDFAVESYVSELHDVLNRFMLDASPRCRAYERLMKLNDNEFITVLNVFYNTFGVTVRSKMNATFQSGCTIFGKQWDNAVYDRMEQLNVIA